MEIAAENAEDACVQEHAQCAPQQDAARYQHFYEPQQNAAAGQRARKGQSPWGYIITGVLCFVVGALFACLFLKEPSMPGDFILEGMPFATQSPAQNESAGKGSVQPTPPATPRPAPKIDGMAPTISDAANPIPDIVEQVSGGVIGVNGYASPYGDAERMAPMSLGSGFLFSTDGYILTCAHIVQDMQKITVTMPDGTEQDAELMGMDKTLDVAVLKIEDASGMYVLKAGDAQSIRVGDFVIAIGDPTGRELSGTTTFGIVSATSRVVNIDGTANTYIQTDAAVNPGSSGGALLNMKGEVVGLTSAKTVTADYDEYGNAISAEGLGFATPIDVALETATELIVQGYVRRAGIGISVIEMDALSAEEYDVPTGMVVYSITKDGPGDEAGLKLNDIIVECDGAPVTTQQAFVDDVKSHGVGEQVKLKVWRSGETLELTLTLGDLNDMGSDLVDGGYADFEFHAE
ncbi:MAG: trypsin-like peptidase domain-containing protein [Clostridia bacterium]|nr:trypsin-like peptidase domain-containing protein [Clostridia bacterium]